jgi:hypothetical protein
MDPKAGDLLRPPPALSSVPLVLPGCRVTAAPAVMGRTAQHARPPDGRTRTGHVPCRSRTLSLRGGGAAGSCAARPAALPRP